MTANEYVKFVLKVKKKISPHSMIEQGIDYDALLILSFSTVEEFEKITMGADDMLERYYVIEGVCDGEAAKRKRMLIIRKTT